MVIQKVIMNSEYREKMDRLRNQHYELGLSGGRACRLGFSGLV